MTNQFLVTEYNDPKNLVKIVNESISNRINKNHKKNFSISNNLLRIHDNLLF